MSILYANDHCDGKDSDGILLGDGKTDVPPSGVRCHLRDFDGHKATQTT